jgi:hypothetical protein
LFNTVPPYCWLYALNVTFLCLCALFGTTISSSWVFFVGHIAQFLCLAWTVRYIRDVLLVMQQCWVYSVLLNAVREFIEDITWTEWRLRILKAIKQIVISRVLSCEYRLEFGTRVVWKCCCEDFMVRIHGAIATYFSPLAQIVVMFFIYTLRDVIFLVTFTVPNKKSSRQNNRTFPKATHLRVWFQTSWRNVQLCLRSICLDSQYVCFGRLSPQCFWHLSPQCFWRLSPQCFWRVNPQCFWRLTPSGFGASAPSVFGASAPSGSGPPPLRGF